MFDYLLIQDVITEFKLVHNIDEVLLRDEIDTRCGCHTCHSHLAVLRVFDDFLQSKELILPSDVKTDYLLSRLDHRQCIFDCKLLEKRLAACFGHFVRT